MRNTAFTTAPPPSARQVCRALTAASAVLGERYAYWYAGAYHFRTEADGWTIAVTPEAADRIRIEACRGGQPMATLWCLVDDRARLAAIVAEMTDEVRAIAA